jgi:hypothetical protein
MKKALISLCLALVLILAFALPAFAGVAALNAEIERLLVVFAANDNAQKLLDDAKIWLADPANADTITDDVAATVIAEVGEAQAVIGDANFLGELQQSQIDSVIASVSAAATAAGLTFEVKVISGINMEFALKDAAGNVISFVETGSPIRQTGTDYTAVIAIALTVLFAAAVTLIVRKRRANEA